MNNFNNFFNLLSQNKNIIITAAIIILLVIAVICCFNKWTEIWFEFGKNIYYLFNRK